MKLFLPLLYSLLILAGKAPEATKEKPQDKVAPNFSEPFSSVPRPDNSVVSFYSAFFSVPLAQPEQSTGISTTDCGAAATLIDLGAGTSSSPFMNCSTNGTYTLRVQNTSVTSATNTGYRINWGDGSATQSFGSDFTTTEHRYLTRGAFNLTFTAIDDSGCESSGEYRVYNMSNPGFTLGNPGSTTACLTPESPTVTFRFLVNGIESNPSSTTYTFKFDDGSPDVVYTQSEMQALGALVHTFSKSSCSMPNQRFSITAVAEYLCGGTPKRTEGVISSIVINESTNADFWFSGGPSYCAGNEVTMGNSSTDPKLCPITYAWTLLDGVEGVDWVYTAGNSSSSENTIRFINPGDYKVKLNTFTEGCGEDEKIKTITISEASSASFDIDKTSGCEDLLVTTTNTSTGNNLSYYWTVYFNGNRSVPNSDYIVESGTIRSVAPQFLLMKPGVYTLHLKADNGCTPTTYTKEITVKGLPTVSFVTSSLRNCGPLTVDYTGQLSITENNSSITSYKWELSNGGDFTGGTSSTSANPVIHFTEPGTHRLKVTVSNECGDATSAEQRVLIYAIPDAPVVAGKTVCSNGAATLTVTAPEADVAYLWYDTPDATREIYSGTTFTTPSLTAETIYYVKAISVRSCENPTRTPVRVSVVAELQGGGIISSPETNICAGSSPGVLDGDAPTGGDSENAFDYQWYASTTSASSGFNPIAHATHRSYTPEDMAETTWFKREVVSVSCANIMSNTVRVDVAPVPPAPTIAGNTTICSGGSTLLFATAPGGTYRWYTAQGTPLHTGASYTTEPLDETTVFEVEVEGYTGCISPRKRVTVEVISTINNSITASKETICKGEDAGTIGGAISGGNGEYVILWEQSVGGMAFTAASGVHNEETYTPGSLTASTTFRRVVNSGGCETRSSTVTININSSIGNNLISGSKTICANSSPGTLSGSGDNTYDYQWYASTTSASDGFTAIAGATGNEYTPAPLAASTWFRREIISGNCSSVSNTVYVQVEESIENNSISTPITAVCTGARPGTITGSEPDGASGSHTYLWQWAKVSEPGNYVAAPGTNTSKDYTPNPNDPALILTEAVYFRRIVISGTCGQSTSTPVMISIVPELINTIGTDNPTLCANTVPDKFFSSIPVSGGKAGEYTYRWERSLNGGPWSEIASTEEYIPTEALAAGTAQYRRWIRSGPCAESRSNTLTINVNSGIAGNELAAVAPVCVGTKVDLQGRSSLTGGDNTRYEYQWEKSLNGTNFFVLTGETEAIYSPVATDHSWFRRVVTSGSCTDVSAPVEVQVEQPVTVQIAGAQSLCLGTPLGILQVTNLTGSGSAERVQWQKSESGEAGPYVAIPGATASEYQPGNITMPTWFRVSVRGGSCATATSNAVKVQYYPQLVNSIGNAQTLCLGSVASPLGSTVAVSGGDGVSYNYQWQRSTDGVRFTNITGQNGESFAPDKVSQRTWFRRIVYSGGCEATSDAVVLNVVAAPANTISIGNNHICFNSRPERIVSGGQPLQGNSGPYTFSWLKSTDGLTFTEIAGAVSESYQPDVLTTTTWFRRVVRSQTCGALESNIIMVQVDQRIEENYIKNGDRLICLGQNTAKLEGSTPTGGTGAYTYLWLASTQGPNTGFIPATGTNTGRDYTPADLERTTWFKRTAYSSPCQEATSAALKIEVVPLPAVPEAASTKVCVGKSTVLTATAAAGETVEWYDKPAGGKLLGTGSALNTGKLHKNTTYYVQATNSNACMSPGRRQVTVEIVTPEVSISSDITTTEGKSVQLQAKGGVQYQWSPAEGLSDPTSDSPMAKPGVTTTYTVTVTTAEGCTATALVTVTVVPKIQPANVLTANGDGLNDKFVIKNIENYPDARVEIFNRWGQKVFQSKGYAEAWDGTQNGSPLPVAAYYYIIYLNSHEEPVSGSVTIIK